MQGHAPLILRFATFLAKACGQSPHSNQLRGSNLRRTREVSPNGEEKSEEENSEEEGSKEENSKEEDSKEENSEEEEIALAELALNSAISF